MFGFLRFWKRTPVDVPTARQLAHARKLRIPVTPAISKFDLSNLISGTDESGGDPCLDAMLARGT
jgi:hypothetical protein